jgi:hypothetical protein
MNAPDPARPILEIGDRTVFRLVKPESTTLAWSGPRSPPVSAGDFIPLTARNTAKILRDIAIGRYNLVVCHPPERSVWKDLRHGRKDLRHVWMHRLLPHLRGSPAVPLVVVDSSDAAQVPAHNLSLLDRCTLFFKRELALDRERLLPPRPQAMHRQQLERNRAKLRPYALGLPRWKLDQVPVHPVEKTIDLFFAGQLHTTLRRNERSHLQSLAQEGIAVDVPEGRLAPEEFYRRCAAAWLVWSPEGSGWDCFRHYEAGACRSVAVMNRPTIQCRAPLREGEHVFFYDPDRKDLADVVRRALSDKDRLRRMGEAARAHVLAHHTHAAICADILNELVTVRNGGGIQSA